MKVQVTFEFDDNQRLAIGVKETGMFVPASRTEARSFVTEIVTRETNAITRKVVGKMDEIKASIQVEIDAALTGS